MSRGKRIALIVSGSLVGLVLLLFGAGIVIVQTQWFRDMVRTKLIAAVEDATGGRVEIGGFSFDWSHLRARVPEFVVHGLEAPSDAPLLRAKLIQVDLKLLSPFKGFVDIAYLLVDTPQANVIVYPDGRTNIPAPRTKSTSNKTGLETVVDLAIGRFDLLNGSLSFGNRQSDLNATGQNLRAHLSYNPVSPRYTGEVDINPLQIQGTNVNVKLPVALEKDRITLDNAQLNTPGSLVVISGSMEHLVAPRTSAHVQAQLSLDEVKRIARLDVPLDTRRGPRFATADIVASMDDQNRVQVQTARVAVGQSNIEASGVPSNVEFRSTLALGELGRLLRVSAQPEGTARINGTAAIGPGSDYRVQAKLDALNVAFRQASTRVSGVQLDSNVIADPNRIALSSLRLQALGGELTGSADLVQMAQFHVNGNLHHFDVEQLARPFLSRPLGYDGIISGPVQASGNIKNTSAVLAKAALAIAPGPRGIPVSGRLNADYNGPADTITLGQSYLVLPHTRIDLSGALGRQINVHLVSRNFDDFKPFATIPVTFPSGAANVNATVSGSVSAPRIAAQATMTGFAVDGRPFDRFVAAIAATQNGVAVNNAVLSRGSLQAQFTASAGLRKWSPEPNLPLRVDATVRNAAVEDALALADQSGIKATGALSADAHIGGTIGSPTGDADLSIVNGAFEGEPIDSLTARVQMTANSINVPSLALVSGPSRVDANASYQHPVNNLQNGSWRAHVASNQVQLARIQPLIKDRPTLHGVLTLNADAAGTVRPAATGTDVELASLNSNFAVRGLQLQGKQLGDLTATANSSGSNVQYNLNSDLGGSTIHVTGQSLLTGDHQTAAQASISKLPIDTILTLAGDTSVKATGDLNANARFSAAFPANSPPRFDTVNADVQARGLTMNGKPMGDLTATAVSSGPNVQYNLNSNPGGSTIHVTGQSLLTGDHQTTANASISKLPIETILALAGDSNLNAGGSLNATAQFSAAFPANSPPRFDSLNADVQAGGLTMNGKAMGDLTATARTQGHDLSFNLTSNVAQANIRGSGRMQLAGDYPLSAQGTFSNVTYSALQPLLGGTPQPLEALAEGQFTVSGPVQRTEALQANLQISKLTAHSVSTAGRTPRIDFEVHNAEPVVVGLDHSVATIRSAKFAGTQTNLSLSGTAGLASPHTMNLRADGNIHLEILEAFDPDIYSSGAVTLNAAVTGTADSPSVNGRLQLQNAGFQMESMSNGLSNANGTILFTGNQAAIQNLTGEVGGGKLTATGFISLSGPGQFRVQTNATGVRVEASNSLTVKADAVVTIAGTADRSLASGTVTIRDIAVHSDSDIGSVLTSAATPPSSSSPTTTGPLAGLRFDVKIQTAANAQFHTSLTQNLQADANLTLRGTIDQPGMLGRIVVTGGNVIFFGNKYSIDQGTVAFYNARRIEPVLNVALETSVQGVDVSINVSGSVDRMKLTYRSDPPMQFQDLVSLLASGKLNTTDPVLAARQPVAPQQNLEQMGASTLLGQAVANPVSGRLQRLFGVSQLKIDPQILGSSTTPQATMTLQQQITKDLTFTYIQDVSATNPQVVRVEWALSPQFSAVAQRDVNGIFDLNFFYKKKFR